MSRRLRAGALTPRVGGPWALALGLVGALGCGGPSGTSSAAEPSAAARAEAPGASGGGGAAEGAGPLLGGPSGVADEELVAGASLLGPEPRSSAGARSAGAPTASAVASGGPAAGPAGPEPEASEARAEPAAALPPIETLRYRARLDLTRGPLYLTGSFDGSQRFGMWSETLAFARRLRAAYGKPVHFTYFVNSCYYDPHVRGSQIGRAESAEEVLVRRALTQQALNEGHEIGNHSVRHRDGSRFSEAEWRAEIAEFDAVMQAQLFVPVPNAAGEPGFVFPRFAPLEGAAPGATGATCAVDADCASHRCLPLTPEAAFCTEPCNSRRPCPAGTVCGTPAFRDDTDACVPVPRYPVVHRGIEMFDARGVPNPAHPDLVRYAMKGFRAPNLGYNDALLRVLGERHYRYDASQVYEPGLPLLMIPPGRDRPILGFGLSAYPGTPIMPMDFNYYRAGRDGARMQADYESNILQAYPTRTPWAIGHHFATWRAGEYWRAMQHALELAARGCPDASEGGGGGPRCPDVELVSYAELYARLRAVARAAREAKMAAASASASSAGAPPAPSASAPPAPAPAAPPASSPGG
ncbi:MAG: polysaccharide deacetylase family protein [Polyangiaceae bacterium]|nr:polysaccharide deacetylase family protein [Polyangiaceae bacterium]